MSMLKKKSPKTDVLVIARVNQLTGSFFLSSGAV